MKSVFRAKLSTAGIVFVLAIFLSFSISCKSPESSDNVSATISVSNECGLAIDVYMDGVFQFSVEFLYYDVIQNVPAGSYEIVAKKKDTEDVLSTVTVDVNASGDYWVTILSAASINIINNYGETLNIYTNGSLQGELDHEESQLFSNVPYGDHTLEASKASDNTLVATTIISVVEEKEYTWEIK